MDVDDVAPSGGNDDGGGNDDRDTGGDSRTSVISDVFKAADEHANRNSSNDDEPKPKPPEPKTAKAAAPAPAAATVPAPPTIDPATYFRAAAVGKDQAWVSKFKSPEALNEALAFIEQEKKAANSGGKQQPADAAAKAVPTFKAEDIPDLNPEEYDEPVVKGWSQMKQLLAHQAQALTELQSQLQTGTQSNQLREAQEFYNWFDDSLTKFDGAKDLFGEGYGDEMDQTLETFKNRDKLWNTFMQLREGATARGESVPRKETLLKQAYAAAFGDQAKKQITTTLAGKIKKNGRSFTMAPTDRNGSPQTGDQVAKTNVAKIMSKIRSR